VSPVAIDLTQFTDQKVIMQVKLDEPNAEGATLVEVEGTALAANALGVLLKPKGRTKAELVEADKIESIEFAPEKARPIKPTSLKVVAYGEARKHLGDRHGVTITWLNSVTEADAMSYHGSLDHSDLAHNHDPKAKDESEVTESE
jgi:hypothetical protein